MMAPPIAANKSETSHAQSFTASDDRPVVATLQAQLLDEMERLASEEAHAPSVTIPNSLMQTLSVLYLSGLHYLLVGCSDEKEMSTWVDQALTTLQRTCAISTHYAHREHFERPAQREGQA